MKKMFSKNSILTIGLFVFALSFIAPVISPTNVYADANSACKQSDKTIRDACKRGYAAGNNNKSNPCNNLQVTLKNACNLGFERGKKDNTTRTLNANANKKCKQSDKAERQACEKGYKAGFNGGNKNTCNSYRNDDVKQACIGGHDKGKADRAAAARERAKETGVGSLSGSSGTGPCNKGFFGLVPWWKYIPNSFKYTDPNLTQFNVDSKCEIKCFNIFPQGNPNECGQAGSDIPYVLLAIVDNLLRIAGVVAVVFVIVGAVRYITSQGNPEDAASAQSTIINALIGMAIAIVAVAFVSFIGNRIT